MPSSHHMNDEYTYTTLTNGHTIHGERIIDRLGQLKLIDLVAILGSIIFVAAFSSIVSITAVLYLNQPPPNQQLHQQCSTYDDPSLDITAVQDPATYFNSSLCLSNSTAALYRSGEFYRQSLMHPSYKKSTDQSMRYTLADVMVIVTTSEMFHRSRCDVMMCTWVREFPPGNVLFASDAKDDLNLLPLLNVMDGLEILGSKEDTNTVTIEGWRAAYEYGRKNNIKFYLRIDDDAFVAPANLLRFINRLNVNHQEPAMYGHACSIRPGRSPIANRFCGGGGELLTKALLDTIHPWFFDQCDPHLHSPHDIFLPRCITRKTGVKPTDAKEFNSEPPEYYYEQKLGLIYRPNGFGQAVTFHYIRPAEKYMTLYALYQAFR